jgi:hypothetical protein
VTVPAQAEAVASGLSALCAASDLPKSESQCADCYEYQLSADIDGQRYEAQVDDVTMGDAGLAGLVTALSELMQSALAGEMQ